MRISDWSSDVCSSDLLVGGAQAPRELLHERPGEIGMAGHEIAHRIAPELKRRARARRDHRRGAFAAVEQRDLAQHCAGLGIGERSEEHTSELQSLMRTSYAVSCLKKKKTQQQRKPQK